MPVEIYTYSHTGKIRSSQLLGAMDDMLQAAGRFLGKLPVDRYTFLYHFDERPAGAWEHSLSSEYVLQESEFTDSVGRYVKDIAAHEFFHIVTPLNIHSEIIEHFNFVTPVPSQHLWLYEGTTEWAAHAIQLRAGLKTPDQYLAKVIEKMRIDRAKYDSTWSLRELALTSYSDSGQAQYGNIYMRGALTAGLLDIRLLELSGGRQGLQDLILELAHRFGKRRAFPESTFVDTLAAMTSPEIRDFFDSLCLGFSTTSDRGVLRQAGDPADRGLRRHAGAVRGGLGSHPRPDGRFGTPGWAASPGLRADGRTSKIGCIVSGGSSTPETPMLHPCPADRCSRTCPGRLAGGRPDRRARRALRLRLRPELRPIPPAGGTLRQRCRAGRPLPRARGRLALGGGDLRPCHDRFVAPGRLREPELDRGAPR